MIVQVKRRTYVADAVFAIYNCEEEKEKNGKRNG